MKKNILISAFVCLFLVSLSACSNKPAVNNSSWLMSASELAKAVNNWKILTNPAFRYEFRYPQNWSAVMSGEDGVVVNVFSADQETSDEDLRIVSYTNWKQNYTIEEFYEKQYQNLYKVYVDREDIEIAGAKGFWFKKVKNMIPDKPDLEVDVITVKTSDSIIEFIIKRNPEIVKTILNSLKFYGNNSIEIK